MKGRVLIIAGSDPSGGAGIQADVKTVTALGGYAATAITALTVQNTLGVAAVHPVAPDIICDQINAVLDDIGADAIKIGMLGEADAAHAIADVLAARATDIPIVVDPVLVATSGDRLAASGVVDVLKTRLVPMATLVTPNAEEAAALTGIAVSSTEELGAAGLILCAEFGASAALVKGGHLAGDAVTDVLVVEAGSATFTAPRLETANTHGTGCALASAAATGLAQKLDVRIAVGRAIAFVHEAIRTAPGLGRGFGPLNHGHTVGEFRSTAIDG